MSQSLTNNYIHIIFSTKYRVPLIDDYIRDRLFNYLGGICKNYGCNPVIIGGYYDHVHILCNLSKSVTVVQLVERIKNKSSKWIKTIHCRYSLFYWQSGYACFSVSPGSLERSKKYIRNQKEHHQKTGFKTELLEFLNDNSMEYNEKYLWS